KFCWSGRVVVGVRVRFLRSADRCQFAVGARCWRDRAGGGGAVAGGWWTRGWAWPRHPLLFLLTRAKNIFDLKTRGVSNAVFRVDGTATLKATGVFRGGKGAKLGEACQNGGLRFWCAQILTQQKKRDTALRVNHFTKNYIQK